MNSDEQNHPVEPPLSEAQTPGNQETGQPVESFNTPTPTLEDKPAERPAVFAEPASAAPEVKKESKFRRVLRTIEIGLLFFLIGAGLIYFILTTKANQQIASLKNEAATAASQIEQLQAELKTANDNLATAQATIDTRDSELAAANLKMAVYKMKMDVDTIRVALLKLDPITAAQALTASRADLNTLTALKVDASTLDGFKKRLDNAAQTLGADPQKSMVELDNLMDNLYLLESNLK